MSERLAAPVDLDGDQRDLYRAITSGTRAQGTQHFSLTDAEGNLQGPFGLMIHIPRVGQPLQALGSALRFETALTDREREIVILAVARLTGSEFEWHAHAAVAAACGLSRQELEALATGSFTGASTRETAIAELASRLVTSPISRSADLPAELPADLVLEAVAVVGYYRLIAQMMGLFDVGAPAPDTSSEAKERR